MRARADRSSDDLDVIYVGFVTGQGGDTRVMVTLAEGMHARGARVKVIVPAQDSTVAVAAQLDELGITCERSDLITVDMTGPRQNVVSMLRLATKLKAPIVHFHTGNSYLPRTLVAALAAVGARRSLVTVHSPYELLTAGSLRARWWSTAIRYKFHAVISPSKHGSRYQRTLGVRDEQALTIHNSVALDVMAAGDPAAPRRELGLSDETPLIVFTSRVDPQKRPVDAVRILARLADVAPDAVLVIVGDGAELERVRETAAELGVANRVELIGHRTDVPNWLAASTVWLLPTERENFSIAVLEALAAGCCVVSTPCRGNDEILQHRDNAMLFDIGDIDAGAAAVRELLEDPTLRGHLSTRAAADQRFSIAHHLDEHVRLYEKFSAPSDRPNVWRDLRLKKTSNQPGIDQ